MGLGERMYGEGIKADFINFYRNNQEIVAGFVAMIALVIAISVTFGGKRAGVIDYGEYTQTLYEMGLSYTDDVQQKESDLRFVKVIEKFKVDHIQLLQLLQLKPSQSLVYPVSIISMICKLMNISFSTQYLAVFLTIITILCIYSITKSAYYFLKEKAAAAGIICSFIFLCGNYTIYFNSLYRNGIYFVSYLAFFSVLFHIVASNGKGHGKIMFLLMFVSLLLLNARETTIVYLPVVIGANIWAMIYCRPNKEKRISYYFIFIILLIFIVRSNILYTLQNEALFSNTQLYHSFFTGILKESDNREELLEELQMDSSLVEDIGKNAYLADENYVISPNSKKADELIFSNLSYRKLWNLYVEHPRLYINVLEETARHLKQIDTRRFLSVDRRADVGTEWVERFVWWQWIRLIIVPDGLWVYIAASIVFISVLGILYVNNRRDKVILSFILLGIFIWLSVFLQFTTIYAWQGFAEEDTLNFYFILTYDMLLMYVIGIILKGFELLQKKWRILCRDEEIETETLMVNEKEPEEGVLEELFLTNPFWQVGKYLIDKIRLFFKNKIFSSPNKAAFFFMVVSAIIVYHVLFYPTRIGAYNNGDFGRMMSAMNIQYTKEDWENSDELSLTKVVEQYDWEENYDYTKILPNHADLSQIWFSVPLKIIDNLVGFSFSTVYVTIMYAVIIVLSLFFIMQVLFHRFGTRAFWFAVALLFIILDFVNLGWLNSLFGEGIAFVSLLMVIACALKIADCKRGTCRLSFLFLFFSELLFLGAKAQYTLTTPVLIIGTLVLFLYHQPKRLWERIPYYMLLIAGSVWLSVSAFQIYHNNNTISSPDTIYQSIFYGLLMLVDDPENTLKELGLDPAMAVDTGKHAYLSKSEYYCPPRTERAEEMLYSKISTLDLLAYYVRHPKLLLKSLDITAMAASKDMPDYTLLVGQKTTKEHEKVERFHVWGTIRSYIVCNRFWELFVIFGLEWILSISYIMNKNKDGRDKMLLGIVLMISAIGILQYPLTFIGNGFADNTKQLYIFRLAYDLTVITGIYLLLPVMKNFFGKLGYCYANQIPFRKVFCGGIADEKSLGGYNYES